MKIYGSITRWIASWLVISVAAVVSATVLYLIAEKVFGGIIEAKIVAYLLFGLVIFWLLKAVHEDVSGISGNGIVYNLICFAVYVLFYIPAIVLFEKGLVIQYVSVIIAGFFTVIILVISILVLLRVFFRSDPEESKFKELIEKLQVYLKMKDINEWHLNLESAENDVFQNAEQVWNSYSKHLESLKVSVEQEGNKWLWSRIDEIIELIQSFKEVYSSLRNKDMTVELSRPSIRRLVELEKELREMLKKILIRI